MCSVLESSVFRITSSDFDNRNFGTGFVITQNENISYLLTCAHVVRDVGGEGNIQVEERPAEVIAYGSPDSVDLAVLRLEGLAGSSILPLRISISKNMSFCLRGFGVFDRKMNQYVARTLEGTVGDRIALESDTYTKRIIAWDLNIQGDDFFSRLEPGYSGSPVCDGDGNVFAVVSHSHGKKHGHAISVANLGEICSEKLINEFSLYNQPVNSFGQNMKVNKLDVLKALYKFYRDEPLEKVSSEQIRKKFGLTREEINDFIIALKEKEFIEADFVGDRALLRITAYGVALLKD